MKTNLLLLTILLLPLASCTTVRLSQQPSPGVSGEFPEIRESVVYIPFSIDLGEVERKIDEALPKGRIFRKNEGCERKEYKVEVFRNKPVKVTSSGGRLFFNTVLDVKASGSHCPGIWQDDRWCHCCCHGGRIKGKADSEIAVQIEVDLKVHNDYSVTANTRVDGEIISGKNIEINLVGFKVSIPIEQVAGSLRKHLEPVKKQMDKEIARQLDALQLKEQLAGAWKEAHQAIPVGEMFLHIYPENIYFQNITSNGTKLSLGAGIGVKLALKTTREDIAVKPLPPLSSIGNSGGHFFIDLPVDAPYPYLSDRVNREFAGKKYQHGNHWVRIEQVSLHPVQINEQAGGLLIDMDITGKADFLKRVKGHLYFTAKPALDAEKETVYLDDFRINAVTGSEIVNKGVEFLINDFYFRAISDAAVYNFSPDIDSLENSIQKELDDLTLGNYEAELTLEAIRLNGIYITPQVLGVQAEASGKIETVELFPTATAEKP